MLLRFTHSHLPTAVFHSIKFLFFIFYFYFHPSLDCKVGGCEFTLSFSNYCGVRRILLLGYSQKKKKSILAGMIYTVACVLQSPTAKLAISCSRTLFQNYGERTSRGCYLSPISHPPPPFSPNYTSLPSPPPLSLPTGNRDNFPFNNHLQHTLILISSTSVCHTLPIQSLV